MTEGNMWSDADDKLSSDAIDALVAQRAEAAHSSPEREQALVAARQMIDKMDMDDDPKLDQFLKDDLWESIQLQEDPSIILAIARLSPEHNPRDVIDSCYCIKKCDDDELTMTVDDLQSHHLKLHLIHDDLTYDRITYGEIEEAESSALLMQYLDEYPQIMDIVSKRRITDTQEVLAIAREMNESGAKSLSDGTL